MKKFLFFLKEYRIGVVTLLMVAMIGDILFIGFKSDLISFTILGLFVIFFKLYKLPVKRIFALSFIPVIVMFFMFFIDFRSVVIEKAAIWLFLLMGAGIIWELLRQIRNETK